MSKTRIKLNADQQHAVEHKFGPLLVVAGAGTGKTRVITERIKHLINTENLSPKEILALTFTDKASHEMVARLDESMPLGYEEPWILTFHSFADRVLRSEGLEIGLDPSYKIMSYPEQWLLIRKNLFKFELDYFLPLGNPTKFISSIIKFISRLQDENITVSDLEIFAQNFKGDDDEKQRWSELAAFYKKYEALKIEKSKMDFGDLIVWIIKLFNERPNILKKYQTQFKHVLVDEFQDTNYAQYELVKILCPENGMENRSLLVVGDDSQSIYKFRGAAVSNILEFMHDFPKAQMFTLLNNYRSTQHILDPAYKLIQNNNPDTLESKLGISKELKSHVKEDGMAEIYKMANLEDEVDFTLDKIIEILGREPSYNYKDIAILARANSHLEPFVMGLRRRGLPYQLVGNRGLYDRDEIRDALALLKVVVNPNDSISLYRVLNIETLNIDTEVISKILSTAKYKKLDLWTVMKELGDENTDFLCEKIHEFQAKITDETPTNFVYQIINAIKYLDRFLKEETIENKLALNNLNLFLDRIKRFEVEYRADNNETPTLVDLLEYLELMIEAGENPAQAEIEDVETIKLLTVHSSKGLEFGAVFMVNLVSGRFPTNNRTDAIEIPDDLVKEILPSGDAHIQEERRLFYVGMTRAKKYLYLMSSKNYGGKRDKSISGYVSETGLKINEIAELDKAQKQESLFGVNSTYRSPKIQKVQNFLPTSMSFSRLSVYQTCPLKYKYMYILNIPTPPNHALSFGITIHDTLREFHTKLLFGDMTLEELYEIYKKNWQPLGYLDNEHQHARFESGKALLQKYYEKNKGITVRPLELEKSFTLQLGGVKFFGRIDRIDPCEDGGVEIIDYKTGGVKTQKQVDSDEQVALYAIAAKEALGLNPTKLTYNFIEGDEIVTTLRTEEQLEATKQQVKETVEQIRKGNFEHKPGMHCTWCDYKDICPYAWTG